MNPAIDTILTAETPEGIAISIRPAGFAVRATAFLIDWLKTKAPFWKREDFAGGGGAWVNAREDDDAAAARWS